MIGKQCSIITCFFNFVTVVCIVTRPVVTKVLKLQRTGPGGEA